MIQNLLPKKLLPVGFYDLLFDEAEKNHQNINAAIDAFLKAKYRLIKMPLVEFEDNFSNFEPMADIENSFRVTDIISGKNLVFRNDITPQISRLLNSRLKDIKLPLRLCYVGDVLCARNNDLHKDRQQTQVGVEIIGCDEEKSNFEIIQILLQVLKKIQENNGFNATEKNLLIEFSLPNFLDIFLDELDIENKEELRAAIVSKNVSLIKKLAGENGEIISKIALFNHDLKNLAEEISAKIKSNNILPEIKRAQVIADFLHNNFPEIKVCFDLFGDNKNSYHQDIAFDVFYGDFSYAVAKGGRYKIAIDGNKKLNAVGATIYMNHLRKA